MPTSKGAFIISQLIVPYYYYFFSTLKNGHLPSTVCRQWNMWDFIGFSTRSPCSPNFLFILIALLFMNFFMWDRRTEVKTYTLYPHLYVDPTSQSPSKLGHILNPWGSFWLVKFFLFVWAHCNLLQLNTHIYTHAGVTTRFTTIG